MNRKLLGALKAKNRYALTLPYNLNWGIQLTPDIRQYLSENPIVIADIGCRGGVTEELEAFVAYSKLFAFDADRDECDRLNKETHSHIERRIFPYFVGGENGVTTFNLFTNPAHSSIFDPDERYRQLFRSGNDFAVEKSVEVEARTLDFIFKAEQLDQPDFIKLDTQGSELHILRGARELVPRASMIEVEVEFTPVYAKQPLFFEVAEFLYSNGFELLYLNRVFEQRSAIYQGAARGQIVFGDALFGRREETLQQFDTARLVKYVLLLINFGHTDIAFQLMRQFPSIGAALPSLTQFFTRVGQPRSFGRRLMGRIGRETRSRLEKLIFLLLHLRRSNALTHDSDRSWPVR